MSKILNSHEAAKKFTSSVQPNEDGTWSVPSQVNPDVFYTVSKVAEEVCCPLKCDECNVCVDMYACSCDEHLIHFTVCKHIDAVLMASNAARTDDENVQELPDSVSKEHEAKRVLDSITKTKASISVEHAVAFKIKLETLATCYASSSAETQDKMSKLLDHGLEMWEKDRNVSKVSDLPKEPANKKIMQQPRFYSTKKRRLAAPSSSLSKPTEHQKEILKQIMDGDLASDVISTSSGHEYC